MENKLEQFLNRDDCFFIHYASNGFYNGSSPAPKISCIMIYNQKSNLGYRFSIGDYIKGNSVDEAERLTLENFKLVFERFSNLCFIHWNMGEKGFGFEAIQMRAKELNIIIPVISEDNLFDLSSYVSFISGKRLSIKQILWFNSLLYGNDFLDGREEAECFRKWKYDEIMRSVELKVRGFADVVKLIREDKLKTEAPYKTNDGLTWEERHEAALKREKMREQMMQNIIEHNREVMDRAEETECTREEGFFFFDFAHPIVSLIANWVGNR